MGSQKREMQKKKREKAIRKAKTLNMFRNISIVTVIALVIGLLGYFIYYKTVLITSSVDNYSQGLAEDGTIEGVDVKEYVKLGDYQNIKVEYANLNIAEDYVDKQIETVLNNNKDYITDEGIVVQKYDEVNVNYVGKIDGVAFEGGSTAEGGTAITIGKAGYIDDFEDQLIGHKIGSSFDIEVTFPEDYMNTEVAGKDAVFSITLNGIYVKSEFDDAFVKEHLSDVALTAEAYRVYLQETAEKEALKIYMDTYLKEYCLVQEYPKSYVDDKAGIIKYGDMQEFAYWEPYYGEDGPENVVEFMGAANEMEYEASLRLRAQEEVAYNMAIQAIYEEEGLTITSEHMTTVYTSLVGGTEYKADAEAAYGKGYIKQLAMKEAVIEYLAENATIIK